MFASSRTRPVHVATIEVPAPSSVLQAPGGVRVLVDDPAPSSRSGYRRDGRAIHGDLVLRLRRAAPLASIVCVAFGLCFFGFAFGRFVGTFRWTLDAFLPLKLVFPAVPGIAAWAWLKHGYSSLREVSLLVGVRDRELFVASGLFSSLGGTSIPVASVRDVVVQEREWREPASRSFHLIAVVDGGREVPLLHNLGSIHQAQFLQQQLRERVGVSIPNAA